MITAFTFPLAGLTALAAIGFLIKRRLSAMESARALTEQRSAALLAEDPSMARFFRELHHGLTTPAAEAAKESQPQAAVPEPVSDALEEFFASVPGQIASLRKLFSEISRASGDAARKRALLEFAQQIASLKEPCTRPPELRPIWLMTCALEGLLKQLSSNTAEVTTSVLGTVAGAVDLLESLCVRGLNPDLATEPPVRILAVDDDPVSRLAISFALKRAFSPPDLAPGGDIALGLIARQVYDVIFLDVEMPGMDGYELCTRIHQTEGHQMTPIVFVTRHSDFQSRAKSTLSGGEDLIAKPFLAFEITVKALTLALRGRLQHRLPKSLSANRKALATRKASELAATASPVAPQSAETLVESTAERNLSERQSDTAATLSPSSGQPPQISSDRGLQTVLTASQGDAPDAFFSRSPSHFKQLRHQLHAAQQATGPADLLKFLGQLYVGVHTLSSEAERAELRSIARLSSALEAMLKKLLDRTSLCSPSTFSAAAAALELLEELCGQTQSPADLTNPPVRILVVDDDPVARRAVSMAIQLVFGRPDNAESGEAAVALAEGSTFDLIFLDVLMPGMDGFTACPKIHATEANQHTPVVFVTSHDDVEARSKATAAGGCGFIPKPTFSNQITLTALTFILRARLKKSAPTTVVEDFVAG